MTTPPPTGSVAGTGAAVELLERALAYTCGALATVTPDALARPTPCARWRLGDLLAHMEDSLDAFTEAAAGSVHPMPRRPSAPGDLLGAVRSKATALLGAWTPHHPGYDVASVRMGTHSLPPDIVAGLAALEIAVHGWDVGRSTGLGAVLPPALARDLEPWAHALVVEDLQTPVRGPGPERARRFAPPIDEAADGDPATRLLGLVGRRSCW